MKRKHKIDFLRRLKKAESVELKLHLLDLYKKGMIKY